MIKPAKDLANGSSQLGWGQKWVIQNRLQACRVGQVTSPSIFFSMKEVINKPKKKILNVKNFIKKILKNTC